MSAGRALKFNEAVKQDKIKFREYIVRAVENGLNEDLFTLDLSGVDKLNPKEFFDRTVLTSSIRDLVDDVLGRLAGRYNNAAFLLDTVMGGGKTHALAYIYLLIKKRSVVSTRPEIQDLIRRIGLSEIPPAEVIVVDGRNLPANVPLQEQVQLRDYLRETTVKGVTSVIDRLGKPVVFIVDEILEYFNKRPKDFSSDLSYLRTLIEGVCNSDNSAIIISVPGGDATDRDRYDRLVSMFKTVIRNGKMIQPLGGVVDLTEIVRRQLLESVDKDEAESAAREAERIVRRGNLAFDDKYRESYPFHPMLIRAFGERFSTFPNFQRTRTTLKLLAQVAVSALRNVEEGKSFESPFITLGDVDVSQIKELSSSTVFTITNLDNIAKTDVESDVLDPLEKRIARAVYIYSLHNEEAKRGLKPGELYEALLDDNSSVPDLARKARELQNKSSYMYYLDDVDRFVFKSVININTRIRQEASKISDINREIGELINGLSESFGDDVKVIYPFTAGDLKKDPDRLNIIYIPLGQGNGSYIGEEGARRFATEHKLFKNGESLNNLVVIAPSSLCTQLIEVGKEYRAAKQLRQITHDGETLKEIKEAEKSRGKIFESQFYRCYTVIVWRSDNDELRGDEISSQPIRNDYINEVKSFLEKEQRVYFDSAKINIAELIGRLFGERVSRKIADAYSDIKVVPAIPYLPRRLFDEILKKAVEQNLVEVARIDPVAEKEQGPAETQSLELGAPIRDSYYIVKKEYMESIRKKKAQAVELKGEENPTSYSPTRLESTFVQKAPPPPESKSVRIKPLTLRETTMGGNPDKLKRLLDRLEIFNPPNWPEIELSVRYGSDRIVFRTNDKMKTKRLKQLIEDLAKFAYDQNYEIELTVKTDPETEAKLNA
ncbi:MAG: hypothetical protein QW453_01800 [Thermoprotei archaeon]